MAKDMKMSKHSNGVDHNKSNKYKENPAGADMKDMKRGKGEAGHDYSAMMKGMSHKHNPYAI